MRNTKDDFSDLVMVIACSMHHLRIDRRKKPLKLYQSLISDKVYFGLIDFVIIVHLFPNSYIINVTSHETTICRPYRNRNTKLSVIKSMLTNRPTIKKEGHS